MRAILAILLLLVCRGLPAQTLPTGKPQTLASTPEEVLFPAKFINFTGADLGMLPRKYSELVGRNVLRSPTVEPALKASVHFINQTALTRTEAIQAFQAIFATNGVALVEDGEKFLQVVRAKDAAGSGPGFARPTLAKSPGDAPASTNAVLFPPRSIIFNGAELGMLLRHFSELIGRKPLRSPQVEPMLKAPVFFVNQTPLTKSEAIRAYDMIFALNGVGFIEEGEAYLKVVPVWEIAPPGQEKSTGSATGAGAEKSPPASGAAKPSTPPKK